jgi:hypothetical protein
VIRCLALLSVERSVQHQSMTPLPKGALGSSWTFKPIATLDTRRSPESVCSVRVV